MKFLLIIFLGFMISASPAQDANIGALLKRQAVDISDGNLSFLDSAVRGRRIVFLGESAHGDGTTLELKSNVIKYLVEQLDFRVVIFETNFFETSQFVDLSKQQYDIDLLVKVAFNVQNKYNPVTYELVKSLLRRKQVNLEGFDITYNSLLAEFLEEKLRATFQKNNLLNRDAQKSIKHYVEVFRTAVLLDQNNFSYENNLDFKLFEKESNSLVKCLTGVKENYEISFLKQVLKSNLGLATWIERRGILNGNEEISRMNSFHEIRDKYMADNLLWLITNKYKDDKIIVTTSTYHIAHSLDGVKSMGSLVSEQLSNESVYYPFLYFKGISKYSFKNDVKMPKPIQRSDRDLEFFFHRTNFKTAFLDFRYPNLKLFIDTTSMCASDALPRRANWTNVFDGVFFVDEMKPVALEDFTLNDIYYLEKKLRGKKKI